MKYLSSLLFLFSGTIYAQTWIAPNATWHYDLEELSGTGVVGFYRYSYTEDSLVGGHLCQRIDCKSYEFTSWPGVQFLDSITGPTRFTYVSNDTVYYWNEDQFFVLYDFGAAIGDNWIISTTSAGGCNDTSRVEVTDKGSVVLNGQLLRTITLRPMTGSSFGLYGTYVEKFGLLASTDPTWHLFPRYYDCDSSAVIEWYNISFKCFEDDNFLIYNPSGTDCEYFLTHLGIEDGSKDLFTIYPNPADKSVTVSSPVSGLVQIFSISGQEVSAFEINESSELDLLYLQSGTYLIRFISTSGKVTQHTFIKN